MQFLQKNLGFITALIISLTTSGVSFAEEAITNAIAVIHPTGKSMVHGIVTFTAVDGGVHIVADVSGLTPGQHGIHVHEYGDCSAPDGSSAGGHFNPTNKMHGCPDNAEHHVGDMGNIVADKEGHGHYDAINKDMTFEGSNNIIGRSVIIHDGKDDCKSQPAGNSGSKIGCGVIGITKGS